MVSARFSLSCSPESAHKMLFNVPTSSPMIVFRREMVNKLFLLWVDFERFFHVYCSAVDAGEEWAPFADFHVKVASAHAFHCAELGVFVFCAYRNFLVVGCC